MEQPSVLLLIPPLTQLNTPYPATAYLTGFLRHQGYRHVRQGDLGIDLFAKLFTAERLTEVFDAIERQGKRGILRNPVFIQRQRYIDTIDAVVAFLQGRNSALGWRIVRRNYLPEGKRFAAVEDLDWYFGSAGIHDLARYLASLYVEDLVDLIAETVGPHLHISRYAERIARTASSFDPLEDALEAPNNLIDDYLIEAVAAYFANEVPDVVGFTVPFSGNLYGALKAGQWIKRNHPTTLVVMGGGYPNTELRDLTHPRVFNYVDAITLDDGEGPILALLQSIHPQKPKNVLHEAQLKRTFICVDGSVTYRNNRIGGDFGHARLPAPDYDGLRLDAYFSMFDMPNPMHRMWNDGRWNKLTLAHGCYWKKCSFCDVTLDYIGRYETAPAVDLVDKMEQLIAQTGETGFHFVDEAAPPKVLRELAEELLRRGLQVTWWTNIRFEKTFTPELCALMAESGCVAVTGGLEVASDRLLALMEKGVTVEQVSRVCNAFSQAGVMVHAYLMYGFPTQTAQETIDSLEVVRQLFEEGIVQSAFWHQFAMTAHSPVGKHPEKYNVVKTGPEFHGFANNDLWHDDPTGCDHAAFSDGLNKALYNYMFDNGFDVPLQQFFDFSVPKPTVKRGLIRSYLT